MDLALKGLDIFHNMEPLDIDPRANILLSAAECILSDRAAAYGPPEDNFTNIVAFWNQYLAMREQGPKRGHQLDATDQAIMMVLMKIARLATNPGHEDSYVDAVGYLGCAWRCEVVAMQAAGKAEQESLERVSQLRRARALAFPIDPVPMPEDEAQAMIAAAAEDVTWEPASYGDPSTELAKPQPALPAIYDPGAVEAFMVDFSELPVADEVDRYQPTPDIKFTRAKLAGRRSRVDEMQDDEWASYTDPSHSDAVGDVEDDGDVTLWPAPGGMTYGEAKQIGKEEVFECPGCGREDC